MALSDLQAIKLKIRRLTRSPSTDQISDSDLEDYINTFILYDFPEQLRLFSYHTTFTFYTNPYQDEYSTDEDSFAGATDNPLYNFQNKYLTVNPPFYIAGFQSFYTQSREQFFGIYPKVNAILDTQIRGDGLLTTFSGVINAAQVTTGGGIITQNVGLLQNNVLITSVDAGGIGLSMVDMPVVDGATGYKFPVGNLYPPGSLPTTPPVAVNLNNFVNYATGAFTVTFNDAPASGAPIGAQVVPQQLALPQAVLYYDNKFIVRPVPNQVYAVNFEAYVRPTELLDNNKSPQLQEFFQYIAYGAAKKIFQDRMDLDSVALIEPEFREQENLCLRRTLVQQANQRTPSIYSEQTQFGAGWNTWGFGGPF